MSSASVLVKMFPVEYNVLGLLYVEYHCVRRWLTTAAFFLFVQLAYFSWVRPNPQERTFVDCCSWFL